MLSVLHTHRRLQFQSPGRLFPWLGLALRGLAGARLKGRSCRHSLQEQHTRWRFCKGCPHQVGCAYGETLEGTSPRVDALFKGQEEGLRPIVIVPTFPAPERVEPGQEVSVCVRFLGTASSAWAGEFWSALAGAGRDPAAGLDPDGTPFRVLPLRPDHAVEVSLPASLAEVPGRAERVRVELTAPLFLRDEISRGKHRLIRAPLFTDLFRACLRTLGGLCALYGQRLDADFAGLKAAAERVRVRTTNYRDFRQPKHSRRSEQHGIIHGVVGWGEYQDVPLALLPWLEWGGVVHVGPHRVAGAGGWVVRLVSK
jgi:hypothetical protein